MKNLLQMFRAFCAVFAAALLLCSCSSEEENGLPRKVKIGVSVPAATHGWPAGVVWHADQMKLRYAEDPGAPELIVAAAGSSEEQVRSIENMMLQDVEALVIMTQEPDLLESVCRDARNRGIYLVIVSNPVTEPGETPIENVFVNGDNEEFGRQAAHAMGKLLNGKGKIAMLEGIQNPINKSRVNGFRQALREYPGIEIIATGVSNWSTEKGQMLMENILQQHAVLDGVWAGDDDVLEGVLNAYASSGRSDVRAFVGGGGKSMIVKYMLDGNSPVGATVTYPPDMICTGIEAAADALKNGTAAAPWREITVRSKIVTRENAAEFYHPGSPY